MRVLLTRTTTIICKFLTGQWGLLTKSIRKDDDDWFGVGAGRSLTIEFSACKQQCLVGGCGAAEKLHFEYRLFQLFLVSVIAEK